MKKLLLFLAMTSILLGCGDQINRQHDSESYRVRTDLNAAGRVSLSFEQVFLYRDISVGQSQSIRCKEFGKDYEKNSGIAINTEQFKLSFEPPTKHCARRNFAKQCETYQFVFTFICNFETK
ncbi:MAG: hypothetical protein NTX25_11370 [Proteobacteria bacterium]|nr:hypothetical protein [Pseudomonadota bacterium]